MIISGVLMLRTIVDLNMYPDTNSTDEKAITYYASIGLLVGGSLMTLIGICGSCGALHESQCLLTTVSIKITYFRVL